MMGNFFQSTLLTNKVKKPCLNCGRVQRSISDLRPHSRIIQQCLTAEPATSNRVRSRFFVRVEYETTFAYLLEFFQARQLSLEAALI